MYTHTQLIGQFAPAVILTIYDGRDETNVGRERKGQFTGQIWPCWPIRTVSHISQTYTPDPS